MPNPVVGSLLFFCPSLVICLWNVITIHKGDVFALFGKNGVTVPEYTDPVVWLTLAAFGLF